MRASLPAPSRLRRRLLPALGGFVVAVVVCLTVPLPIGWLINLGGAAFFPVDSRLRVHVGGATFRWALGDDRVRMEFERMDTTVQGRPLAKFDRTVVEFDKAALWRGLVRPRRILVRGASAVMDFTAGGALRILRSERTDPTASVAPAELLVLMAPLLPKVGEQSELVLERLGVECILGAERWRIAGGSRLLVAHDPAGPLRIKGATSLGGDGREPVPAILEAAIVPAEARAHFTLAIPEFQLSRLRPREVPDEATPGSMSLSVSGSVDLANGDVQAGQIAWSVQDARIRIVPDAPALPLERMVVRGKLERRGAELRGALEEGELRLAGAAVQVRKLEVALASHLRVDWETDVQAIAGTSLLPYFPAELLTRVGWLGPLLRATAVSGVRSAGQAAFVRQGLIASEVHELRSRQALSMAVAGEALSAEITAEKAAGAPLRATVHVPPFVVRRLAPALPAAWRLQQMDVPVQFDAHAHLTGDGRLIDAGATVSAAAGRIEPWFPGHKTLVLQRARIDGRVLDGGVRVEVANGLVETGAGVLRLPRLDVREEQGQTTLAGTLELSETKLREGLGALFPGAAQAILDAGIMLDEVTLGRATLDFSVARADGANGWPFGAVRADAGLELSIGGVPLGLTARLGRSRATDDLVAAINVREFVPAEWGRHLIRRLDLSPFRFPVRIELGARVSAADGAGSTLRVRAAAGPGTVTLPGQATALPFHDARVEAEIDPRGRQARVSLARLALTPALAVAVSDVSVAAAPWRLHGVAKLEPLAMADLLAWWPVGFQPEWRRGWQFAAPAGRVRTDGLAFAVESGPLDRALRLVRAQGGLDVDQLVVRTPGVPRPVEIGTTRVDLDFPRVNVLARDGRIPGATLRRTRLEIADVTADRRLARIEAEFEGDPNDLHPWLHGLSVPPALAAALRESGPVQGAVTGTLVGSWPDFSGTEFEFEVQGDRLVIPDVIEGPIDLALNLRVPTPDAASLDARFALGGGGANGPGSSIRIGPVAVQLRAREWQDARRAVVDVSGAAESVLGLPMRMRGRVGFDGDQFRSGRAALDEFSLGSTALNGAWTFSPAGGVITLQSPRLDLAELARGAVPWLQVVPVPEARVDASLPRPVLPATLAAPPRLSIAADVATVAFGAGRRLDGLRFDALIIGGWPQRLTLMAREGGTHAIAATLVPVPAGQRLEVEVEDAAGLIRTVTEPLRVAQFPPERMPDALLTFARIPDLIAGGRITVSGDLRYRTAGVTGGGSLRLEDATLIRLPRILQLLSLRRGQTFEQNPKIRRLQLAQWSFDPAGILATGVGLEGTGLVDRFRLAQVRYGFDGGTIAMDGTYFGVGFEVVGTRADPQVFLKENALLRALILQPDSGFFNEETKPPPRK